MNNNIPDITNPLHYTIINNPEGVKRIFYKYKMPVPADEELFEASQILIDRHGNRAIKDLIKAHPDRPEILKSETDWWRQFVARYSGIANSSQNKIKDLTERLTTLKAELNGEGEMDADEADYIKDEIRDIEREIAVLQNNSIKLPEVFSEKENRILLYIIIALGLIWLGGKIK